MNHVRHSNIFNVPPYYNVALVGVGGLGATTALVLAKMGVQQMSIWDGDTVSETNIPTQLHPVSDVGKEKVYSLAETLEHFSDEIQLRAYPERITEEKDFNEFHLVIAAVDSIQARKDIWIATTNSPHVDWFLDMRMAAREFQMFLVDMHDSAAVEAYHGMLFSLDDSMILELRCTEKATFFTASLAAGHAGNALCNIVRREACSHRLVHYITENRLLTFGL
jgi:hypothetical protein